MRRLQQLRNGIGALTLLVLLTLPTGCKSRDSGHSLDELPVPALPEFMSPDAATPAAPDASQPVPVNVDQITPDPQPVGPDRQDGTGRGRPSQKRRPLS